MSENRNTKVKRRELTALMQKAYAVGDTHKAYEYSRQIRNLNKAQEEK